MASCSSSTAPRFGATRSTSTKDRLIIVAFGTSAAELIGLVLIKLETRQQRTIFLMDKREACYGPLPLRVTD